MAQTAPRQEPPHSPGLKEVPAEHRPSLQWLWPAADCVGTLEDEALHVWAFSLKVTDSELRAAYALLSSDERIRASRFHFQIHRTQFVVARASLRRLLGRYSGRDPRSVNFSYNLRGKPSLAPHTTDCPLAFNLAHSCDFALVAVSRNAPVGIDVEKLCHVPRMEELVTQFFSQREAGIFRALPEAKQVESFFNLWTRKEALLKATGEGIGSALRQVEVTFLPEFPPVFLSIPNTSGRKDQWKLVHLLPASGYIGALAHQFDGGKVCCRWWDAKTSHS